MPASLVFHELDEPRRDAARRRSNFADAMPGLTLRNDVASCADLAPAPPVTDPQRSYFEIYYAERVSLTSILFSGGDWHWRFCSAAGAPIAVSSGYASESACAAAVAALRRDAGAAGIRNTPSC